MVAQFNEGSWLTVLTSGGKVGLLWGDRDGSDGGGADAGGILPAEGVAAVLSSREA